MTKEYDLYGDEEGRVGIALLIDGKRLTSSRTKRVCPDDEEMERKFGTGEEVERVI
jgi:outer membrane receptor for ferrienterochelin and colicin